MSLICSHHKIDPARQISQGVSDEYGANCVSNTFASNAMSEIRRLPLNINRQARRVIFLIIDELVSPNERNVYAGPN